MLEYAFETVDTNRGFFIGRTEGHREIVLRRAAEGWRYAGFIPVRQGGYGATIQIDLVFERERPED